LLTLVVVPVIYCFLDDLSAWVGRRLGRRSGNSPAPSGELSGDKAVQGLPF
jgi:HAE1 family hydrophobic/amphiphilic exporter-1